jgi:hypothetical protein
VIAEGDIIMASQEIVVRFSNTVEDWDALQSLASWGVRLWWKAWPAVFFAASLAAPFAMLLFAGYTSLATGIAVFLTIFTTFRFLPRRSRPNERFLLPKTYVFSERGVRFELAGEVGEWRWPMFATVLERTDFLALEIPVATFIIVPRRAFDRTSDFTALVEFVRKCKSQSLAQDGPRENVLAASLAPSGQPSVTYRNTSAELAFVRFTGFGKARFSIWNDILIVGMCLLFIFMAAAFYSGNDRRAFFGALFAAVAGFFIAHLLARYLWRHWFDRGQLQRLTVTLAPRAICIDGTLGWTRSDWSLVQSILESPSFFGLMTKERKMSLVIPKKAFASPHDAATFRNYAISLIAASDAPPIVADLAARPPAAIDVNNPYQSPQMR